MYGPRGFLESMKSEGRPMPGAEDVGRARGLLDALGGEQGEHRRPVVGPFTAESEGSVARFLRMVDEMYSFRF